MDICEDTLIDRADELGGSDCVDATLDAIDCVVDSLQEDCQGVTPENFMTEGGLDDFDVVGCDDELVAIEAACS